jgi:tryptophanyl-tRNA synthetase
MIDTLAPIRARAMELKQDPAAVDRVLARGAERARTIARATLAEAKRRMGFFGVS